MYYDDESKPLPWDYFLTNYERDLLTQTIEEMVRRYPDKTAEDLKAEMAKMNASQADFIDS